MTKSVEYKVETQENWHKREQGKTKTHKDVWVFTAKSSREQIKFFDDIHD